MSARDWADFRAPDFKADLSNAVAVLPTAAIEQHGPHLPVGTDTLIMEGMLARVKAICPADLDLRILPVMAVGKSNEHLWAKGTLTLTAPTALAAWTEIGLSVARAGIRRVIIVNSHGGNADLVSILSRELRVQAGMLAVRHHWTALGKPDGLFSERESRFGIHGGDYETSLMLAFHPELVDMAAAKDFPSSAEAGGLLPTAIPGYGWVASDLNPEGAVGEAHLASAEKGRQTVERSAADFISLARQVSQIDISGFKPISGPA